MTKFVDCIYYMYNARIKIIHFYYQDVIESKVECRLTDPTIVSQGTVY